MMIKTKNKVLRIIRKQTKSTQYQNLADINLQKLIVLVMTLASSM